MKRFLITACILLNSLAAKAVTYTAPCEEQKQAAREAMNGLKKCFHQKALDGKANLAKACYQEYSSAAELAQNEQSCAQAGTLLGNK